MKKRAFCLFLCLAMAFCFSAQASSGSFYRHLQYGMLVPYENYVYHYSLKVFDRFEMVPDEFLEPFWEHWDAEKSEDDDEIYDIRFWLSQDGRYELEVQVKQPSYDSFETEIAKAPEYADLVADGYAEENHLRMIHDGILRSTPAGDMLEIAVAYDTEEEDGHVYTTVFVYYDIYANDMEYCFSLYAYDGDYETAQSLLDEICQTVELTPVGFLA